MKINRKASRGAFKQMQDIEKKLKRSNQEGNYIGVNEGAGYHPDQPNLSLADLAVILSNGSTKLNLPARPFLTTGVHVNLEKFKKDFEKLYPKYLAGDITLDFLLDVLGREQVEAIKAIMGNPLYFTPNVPSVARAKGGNNTPLIETSALRDSISSKRI